MDYEILDESTVPRYLGDRPDLVSRIDADTVEAREVGDGNLNLVFVCHDARGRSLALEQSLPYVRVAGPSWPLTADRSISESIGLGEAARAFARVWLATSVYGAAAPTPNANRPGC